jgi:hypothetical protein
MGVTAARLGSECWAPRGGKVSPEECGARTGGHGLGSVAYGGGTTARRRMTGRRDIAARVRLPARQIAVQPSLTKFYSQNLN